MIYSIISILIIFGIFYYIKKIIKRINNNKLIKPTESTIPSDEDFVDNFICFLRTDGSTTSGVPGCMIKVKRTKK